MVVSIGTLKLTMPPTMDHLNIDVVVVDDLVSVVVAVIVRSDIINRNSDNSYASKENVMSYNQQCTCKTNKE